MDKNARDQPFKLRLCNSDKSNSREKGNSSVDKDVKEGWGGTSNFNASYGLKPTPEGYEEGKAIKEAMEKADTEAKKNGGSK